MNEETRLFVENEDFNRLYQRLSAEHKPIKANLSNEDFAAIGKVIVKFQRLENTIRDFIRILPNININYQLFDILTNHISFKNLVRTLHALLKKLNSEPNEDLEVLIKQCFKAEEIRNQIVHSLWASKGRFKTTTSSSNNGLQYKYEEYETGELNSICDKIDKLDTAIEAMKLNSRNSKSKNNPRT